MKKCDLSERIPGVSEGLHGFGERLKQECSVVCLFSRPWFSKTFWETGGHVFCGYTVLELGILQNHRFRL